MFKNILIIGHSNIGDACYNAVVAAPLREQFPRAGISILTSSRTQNIFQGYAGIDKVFLYIRGQKTAPFRVRMNNGRSVFRFRKPRALARGASFDTYARGKGLFGYLRLISALRKEKFDLAVVLNSSLLYKFLGIPRVWSVRGYLKRRPSELKKHIADIYLEFLKAKGVSSVLPEFHFNPGRQEEIFAWDFLKNQSVHPEDTLIGILPIAAWSLKSWPIGKWNELAKALKVRCGAKLIALGKSGNDPFSRGVLKDMSSDIINAIDKTGLRQAMAILKRCKLFIAPDSSLLHLASCMGVETIGLYGATCAEYIYPYFHHANMIVSKAALKCMPCYPGDKIAVCKKEFQPGECMDGISVEDVLAAVEAKLHRNSL